ncbi:MAG: cysteine hydrolase family protein [Thermoplasmataceae archaeon]
MEFSIPENSALILIDVQVAWNDTSWGRRNNPKAEEVMSDTLALWRKRDLPVFHVRHDSRNPESLLKEGKPGFEFKPEVTPVDDEPVIVKHVNSGFIGTDLEQRIRAQGIHDLFFAGITTDHCVSTTVRMAANLGFRAFVIEDACVTFDRKDLKGMIIKAEDVHSVNLASLKGEFATILRYEDLSQDQ